MAASRQPRPSSKPSMGTGHSGTSISADRLLLRSRGLGMRVHLGTFGFLPTYTL